MLAEELVEYVVNGYDVDYVLDLFEGWSPDVKHYDARDHLPIKLIIRRYNKHWQTMWDASMPVWYTPEELWRYREYDWTRDSARSGFAKVDGKTVDLPGPLKWDALVADMRQRGWDKNDPLHMTITPTRALVSEGNHRLAIAKEAGIKVPVEFHFHRGSVPLPARSKKRQDRERRDTERRLQRAKSSTVKQVIKKPSKPVDAKTQKQIDDIMDLLGM